MSCGRGFAMTYLDTNLLESAKRTELPTTRQTATGYGSMIPTQYMVRVCGRAANNAK